MEFLPPKILMYPWIWQKSFAFFFYNFHFHTIFTCIVYCIHLFIIHLIYIFYLHVRDVLKNSWHKFKYYIKAFNDCDIGHSQRFSQASISREGFYKFQTFWMKIMLCALMNLEKIIFIKLKKYILDSLGSKHAILI